MTDEHKARRAADIADHLVAAGLVESSAHAAAVDVIAPVLADEAATAATRPAGSRIAAEIAGYLGGILVVAAAAVFLASQWSRMGEWTRVLVLALSAALLGSAAVAVRLVSRRAAAPSELAGEARTLLASGLAVAAAGLAGTAVGTWGAQVADLTEPRPQTLGFATAFALAALGYRFLPTALAHLAMAVTAMLTALTLVLGPESTGTGLKMAGLALVLAAAWCLLSERGVLREQVLGRFVAGTMAVIGAQSAIDHDPQWISYLLLALAGVVGFALYVRTQSWPYLGLGVLALTLATTEAAVDFSDGALGAAGALLVAGAALLLASVIGLRLRRPAPDQSASSSNTRSTPC